MEEEESKGQRAVESWNCRPDVDPAHRPAAVSKQHADYQSIIHTLHQHHLACHCQSGESLEDRGGDMLEWVTALDQFSCLVS